MLAGDVPRWIILGNFLLGFCLAVLGVRALAFYLVSPIVDRDDSGAAASFFGPIILLFLLIGGLLGGTLSTFLAHMVKGLHWKMVLALTATGGYCMCLVGIVEVIRN
jgi:hypothetical protein